MITDKISALSARLCIDIDSAMLLFDIWSRGTARYGKHRPYLGLSYDTRQRILRRLIDADLVIVGGTSAQKTYRAKLDDYLEEDMGEKKPDLIAAVGLLANHAIWHADLWILAYIATNITRRAHIPLRLAHLMPKQLKAGVKRLEEAGLIRKTGFPASRATLAEYALTAEHQDEIIDALGIRGKGFYPQEYRRPRPEAPAQELNDAMRRYMPIADHVRRTWPTRAGAPWDEDDTAAAIKICREQHPAMVIALAESYVNHCIDKRTSAEYVILFRNYLSKHGEKAYIRAMEWLKSIYRDSRENWSKEEVVAMDLIEKSIHASYMDGGLRGIAADIAGIAAEATGHDSWSSYQQRKIA